VRWVTEVLRTTRQ